MNWNEHLGCRLPYVPKDDIDKPRDFLELPPIPEETLQTIRLMERAAQQLSYPRQGNEMKNSANTEDSLRKDSLPPARPVEAIVIDEGAALRCVRQQVGSDGNPKHRDANEWGIGVKSTEDAEELE